jgi:phage terminase large subunit
LPPLSPDRRIKLWRENILKFVYDNFKVTPDPWQERALLEIAKPGVKRISLQACAGPGKTAVESWAGWWFISTQGERFEHPKGMATAITRDNLRANLWTEFAKWQPRSDYLKGQFTWSSTHIRANAHPETWYLEARTWPKTANADEQGATFSGLHSKYVMVLIDESGAIPTTVLRAAEQALVICKYGCILQAGNPISLEGMLHAAATTLRNQWKVHRITGDPDDPDAWVHAPRLQALHDPANEQCVCPVCWSRNQIATYGRDNPWVKSYILGQFPPSSINTLLGIEDVEAAMARVVRSSDYDWQQKRIGADVARFGDDRTVLFPRQGIHTLRPAIMRQADTTKIAARLANAATKWEAELILIDDTGHWGHGVYDQLNTAGFPVVPVIFHDRANHKRYKNRRTEMWLEMAKGIKGGLQLPRIDELVAELTIPTYTFLGGQFVLEEKDQIKKRLGRSPDIADALALTYAMPDMPRRMLQRLRNTQSVKVDTSNPYDLPSRTVQDLQDVGRASVAGNENPWD